MKFVPLHSASLFSRIPSRQTLCCDSFAVPPVTYARGCSTSHSDPETLPTRLSCGRDMRALGDPTSFGHLGWDRFGARLGGAGVSGVSRSAGALAGLRRRGAATGAGELRSRGPGLPPTLSQVPLPSAPMSFLPAPAAPCRPPPRPRRGLRGPLPPSPQDPAPRPEPAGGGPGPRGRGAGRR